MNYLRIDISIPDLDKSRKGNGLHWPEANKTNPAFLSSLAALREANGLLAAWYWDGVSLGTKKAEPRRGSAGFTLASGWDLLVSSVQFREVEDFYQLFRSSAVFRFCIWRSAVRCGCNY